MTNRQVIKAYAKNQPARCQDGCDGHNSTHSIFWRDSIIWSYGYHFPMAAKTSKLWNGQPLALMNHDSWSVTTSGHQRWTGFELSQEGYKVIPVVLKGSRYGDITAWYDWRETVQHLTAEVQEAQGKAKRARKDWSIRRWEERVREYQEYVDIIMGRLAHDIEWKR